VAILVPDATPSHLRVIAQNIGASPIVARMTAWDVEPGQWALVRASGPDPGVLPGPSAMSRAIDLERSREIEITFAPGVATVLDLRLVEKGTPYWLRPDLGISDRDVKVSGRDVTVTVHSLGAVDAPAARLVLRDPAGEALARAAVPALKAPSAALRPSTTTVSLSVASANRLPGATLTIESQSDVPEITRMNNRVTLPDIAANAPGPAAASAGAPRL
jgi:hypothetical protein